MPRPRNSEREKWVANRQSRFLGVSPEDVLGMIERKGGDYYQSDLYPDQAVMRQAENDFSTFRTGTTAMNQIADDMRSYYGVGSSQPQRVMTNLPPEIEAQVAAVSEPYVRPQPRTAPQPKPQPRIEEQAVSQQESPQMREMIMGGLRKAGERIQAFDEAYGDKIADNILDPLEKRLPPSIAGVALMPVAMATQPAFRKYMDPEGGETSKLLQYGVPAVATTARYVVPAAGVGLAAKGIYDLTQMMNQQTSGTIEL